MNRLVELLGGEVHIPKRPGQRGDVVAVYLGEAEAEGAPFVCERFQIENFRRRTSGLHFIVVEDCSQVRQLVLVRRARPPRPNPRRSRRRPARRTPASWGCHARPRRRELFLSQDVRHGSSRGGSVKLVDLKIALVGEHGVECEAAGPLLSTQRSRSGQRGSSGLWSRMSS